MIASSIMMGRALAPVEVALGSWKQLVAARQGHHALAGNLQGDGEALSAPGGAAASVPRAFGGESCRRRRRARTSQSCPSISFSLKAGTGLALLGASASGKTSLSKALVGIWPARHGAMRLDGAAIDQWGNEDLGRHIGYLPQDVALFEARLPKTSADSMSKQHPKRY